MADNADFTERNRQHWDKAAATYNSKPWQQKMQSQIFTHIQQNVAFIGLGPSSPQSQNPTKLLDYACGTGLVSRALAPHITSTTGIDISNSMAAKFNETFSSAEAPCTGSATVGDLFTTPPSPELDKPELYDFDIAAIGLGFHHFADPKLAVERLVERVKKGSGIVLIIDWLPEDAGNGGEHAHEHGHGHGHGHQHGHGHASGAEGTIRTNGFSQEDMRGLFEDAGCTKFAFDMMPEPVELFMGEEPNVKRKVKRVFLARATRTQSYHDSFLDSPLRTSSLQLAMYAKSVLDPV